MRSALKALAILTLGSAAPAQSAEVVAAAGIHGPGTGVNERVVAISTTASPPFQPAVTATSSYGGANAWAVADLSNGTMRANLDSRGSGFHSGFDLGLSESYLFSIAGANASTITRLVMDIYFDAVIQNSAYMQMTTEIFAPAARYANSISFSHGTFTSFSFDVDRPPFQRQDGTIVSLGDGISRGTLRNRLAFDITGSTATIGFLASANGVAGPGGRLDFGNSAHFGFVVPEGVTVASQSGAAFTTLVSSAVPEPATWTMMITGFGLIGWGLRRRRSSVSRPALTVLPV